jgi:hypothetical protein
MVLTSAFENISKAARLSDRLQQGVDHLAHAGYRSIGLSLSGSDNPSGRSHKPLSKEITGRHGYSVTARRRLPDPGIHGRASD